MKKLLVLLLMMWAGMWALPLRAQTKEIKYVLHKRDMTGMHGHWYSAVIRPIDPKKDDYKGYCRYIVKDITKKTGLNGVTIVIYDDEQAYKMYEGINDGHVLNKQQMAYTEQHEVGIYSGKADDPEYEESYELSFYLDARNGHKATEIYKP